MKRGAKNSDISVIQGLGFRVRVRVNNTSVIEVNGVVVFPRMVSNI